MNNLKVITLGFVALIQVLSISAMKKESEWERSYRIFGEKQREFDELKESLEQEFRQDLFEETGIYSDLAKIIYDYASIRDYIIDALLIHGAERVNLFIMNRACMWGTSEEARNTAKNILEDYRKEIYDRGLSGDGSNIKEEDLNNINYLDYMFKEFSRYRKNWAART